MCRIARTISNLLLKRSVSGANRGSVYVGAGGEFLFLPYITRCILLYVCAHLGAIWFENWLVLVVLVVLICCPCPCYWFAPCPATRSRPRPSIMQ